jgi:hypothetical protein
MTRFTADVYQNEFLALGATDADAVVTVTASDVRPATASLDAAEIVIVDESGSMATPGTKLRAAKQATAAAIDTIRNDVAFAVIGGSEEARTVFPSSGLAIASSETRAAAKEAVGKIRAVGGTAIGTWLTRARELFETGPAGLRHAILLTDGQNQHETPEELEQALDACARVFQCDCRGVGTDWEVAELRLIASRLLGTVDIIPDPDGLAADFRAMMARAMGKATADVALRVWTPRGATVSFVKQVAPTIEDVTQRAARVDELTCDYPTGAWGDESRDYHVSVRVTPRGAGDEMLAARLSLVVEGQVVAQGLVRAIWTEDAELSTRINPEVAHYTGQAELAEVIQEGLEARRAGDEATATFKLGRAVQLASDSGNDGTLQLLGRVLEIDDAPTGTVRLKRHVEEVDEMSLDTRSTRTVRVGGSGP